MHKPASQESRHLAARSFRRRPDRGLSRQAILAVRSAGGRAVAYRGVGAAHQGALRLRSRRRARGRQGLDRTLAEGRADGPARRRARRRSRTISPPRACRCRWAPPASSWCRPPADAPPAARLREAGAIIFSKTTMPDYGMLSSGLSSFHPLTRNPWDLSKNPGGSSAGAGAAACRRLRPAASRHRYRRLGAAAVVLVRPGRAEAEPRADSDRSALCRPRRRSDDPHRRRCRADDERAVEARSPRRHEPAARQHQLEGARQTVAQTAHRPDARSRRRPGAGKRRARGRREGGEGVRVGRRRRHRSRRA